MASNWRCRWALKIKETMIMVLTSTGKGIEELDCLCNSMVPLNVATTLGGGAHV